MTANALTDVMKMTEPQTITGALDILHAPENAIRTALPELARVLPPGITREAFGQWSLNMLTRGLNDPKQARAWAAVLDPANPAGLASVMTALKRSAELGLRPGSEYHLVPYLSKDKEGKVTGATVTGITDYHGEIKLICNWEPCSVVAQLVRANDKYRRLGANIPPEHEFDQFGSQRGEIVGGYAYVAYEQGRCSLVAAMPRSSNDPLQDCFDKHQAKAGTQAIWSAWYEAMCLKTLIHALRDFVPWSATRLWEIR